METYHADPQLVYKFLKNGNVFIRVRDVLSKGGQAYGYRLFTGKPLPDFDLRIEPSNLTVNQQGTTTFTVFALRKFNFMGEIILRLNGLPAGFTLSNNMMQKGKSQLTMTITAPKEAKLGPLNLEIIGKSITADAVVERKAEPVEEKMQAFFNLHLLPTSDFLSTVIPPLPFSISHTIPADSVINVSKDTSFTFKIKVIRADGFNLPVQLVLNNPPNGAVRMKPIVVPAGQTEAMVTFEMNNIVFNQSFNLVVSGTSRVPKTRTAKAKVIKVLSPAIMVNTPKRILNRPALN
jgi:hypothetical protein